ncbi:MAG: DUF4115 domain-containing protein [Chlorobium sp.]|uniref:helix-turn-helix domain-containing protein n=1 Tax=Chlorobium sp. TaxID=1095 RepID=UPI0025BFB617|nr:helix-turn-helix domain-containing protein [Chlorobium sp.]MCF8383147.1 DUF4115 domain-containing protein [Chlorobium sp.]
MSNLSLEQLAAELQKARVRRNLSIDDVSRHTGINPVYIGHIEAGNFTFMPGVYVLAYIKEYAGMLEIGNPETFERCREALLGRIAPQRVSADSPVARNWSDDHPLDSAFSYEPFFRKLVSPKGLLVLTGAVVFLAIVVFTVRMLFFSAPSSEQPFSGQPDALIDADTAAVAERVIDSEFLPVLVAVSDSAASESSSAKSKDKVREALIAKEILHLADSAKAEKPRPAGGRQLEVRIITDETWVKVIADDSARVYAGGQFKKGDVLRYEAQNKFWVNIGRPSYVELFLDGKKMPPLSERTVIYR